MAQPRSLDLISSYSRNVLLTALTFRPARRRNYRQCVSLKFRDTVSHLRRFFNLASCYRESNRCQSGACLFKFFWRCPFNCLAFLGRSTAEEDWIQCRSLASSLHLGIVVDGRQGKVARQTHCAFGIVWRKCRNKIPRPHAAAPNHAFQIATFWGINILRRKKYHSLFLWEEQCPFFTF